ncbi:hypothetical protein M9H77_36915 [Catharanthus roseus]|uniref:Uncharacterized protein n=1 Tax=Catharanthus roseus TaxID=4058 RepID=A0ACB9ZU18_CATRO|nr:hypothetical protein M9H77_36915 [Catharanthus roseus]
MSSKTLSFEQLVIGAQDGKKQNEQIQTETHGFGSEESGLSLDHEQDNTAEEGSFLSKYQHVQQLQQFLGFGGSDDLYLGVVSPPFQSCLKEIKTLVQREPENVLTVESKTEKPPYAVSLEILNKHTRRLKRLHNDKLNVSCYATECTEEEKGQKVSTPEILRFELSMLNHPYAGSFVGLSERETKDVQLVQYLLSAAEKVGEKQFYRAMKLLRKCDKMSFEKGNPVQRLVHYFSAALHERIDRETGRNSAKGVGKRVSLYVKRMLLSTNFSILAFQKAVPLSSVGEFVGMQAILEQVTNARKVHIIDLHIRLGIQYTSLIQALAARVECPVEHLKITAVGTNYKAEIEETGRRLASFADSFNLAFSFSLVMVEGLQYLDKSHFELDNDEALAVYAEYILTTMLQDSRHLGSLIRVIRDMNPCAIVIPEAEGNLNSPIFVERFVEALFYFGAFFDAFEDGLKDDDANRTVMESIFFSQGIKNIVATEGEERTMRLVPIKVWRDFFARFGMVERKLSMSSKYQAKLVLENFPCGSSCTLDMDGESLIIGWKGIPTHSLSVWKFR